MPSFASCPFLWDPARPYPEESRITAPAGICRIMAQDGRKDILPFLLDVSLAVHGDRIYLAWYNSTDAEICGTSLIRGIWSDDGGEHWSEPFLLAGSFTALGRHLVPVNLFPRKDGLWALITTMEGKNITTGLDLYRKREAKSEQWDRVATVAGGFITNTPPLCLANGNWIVGGWTPMKREAPAFPVVLHSQGEAIERPWCCRLLYDPLRPDGIHIRCPEVALHADGARVTAYVRSGNREGPPYVFTSQDFGETWGEPTVMPIPVAGAKMFAGVLSDGRRYLIYNTERGYFVRTMLVLAVADPGRPFNRVWRLFEGAEPELDGRSGNWYYPAACEYKDHLLVGCTLQEADNVRSAVVAKIPLGVL